MFSCTSFFPRLCSREEDTQPIINMPPKAQLKATHESRDLDLMSPCRANSASSSKTSQPSTLQVLVAASPLSCGKIKVNRGGFTRLNATGMYTSLFLFLLFSFVIYWYSMKRIHLRVLCDTMTYDMCVHCMPAYFVFLLLLNLNPER